MVANMLPQAKANEIVEKCRDLLRAIRREPVPETFNNWNTYVVGIHNYYRGMTHFCESFNEIGWRIKKLFYHTMEKRATFTKEQSYKDQFLQGRYRSWGKDGYYCFGKLPIVRIEWANWDSGLISARKSAVRGKNPYDYGEKKHKPGVTVEMITYLVNTSKYMKNSRLAMFRISKYSSVKGISYLSGEFVPVKIITATTSSPNPRAERMTLTICASFPKRNIRFCMAVTWNSFMYFSRRERSGLKCSLAHCKSLCSKYAFVPLNRRHRWFWRCLYTK